MPKQIFVNADMLSAVLKALQELKAIILSDKTNAQWLDEKRAAA